MQLYVIRGAPNSRKAEAVVAHLGLPVEQVELDIRKGEHKTADYLALNPNGLVPTLVDNDFILWESHAVMAYLADRFGAEGLYPKDLRLRAEVDRWMNWAQAHFGRAIGPIFSPTCALSSSTSARCCITCAMDLASAAAARAFDAMIAL